MAICGRYISFSQQKKAASEKKPRRKQKTAKIHSVSYNGAICTVRTTAVISVVCFFVVAVVCVSGFKDPHSLSL